MTQEFLIQLLAKQIQYATGMDGKIGLDASNRRKLACDDANRTIDTLSQMGMEPEEALEKAEAIIDAEDLKGWSDYSQKMKEWAAS